MRPDGAAMVCHLFNETKVRYIRSVKKCREIKKAFPQRKAFEKNKILLIV
jgi:hypothetical protein